MSAFADQRSDIGARAIAGDAPAGADVRGDPDFEALEAEVRRMDADGPAAIRWSFVVETSLAILSDRSKDLLVAVWAAYGLARLEGYPGLAAGLALVEGLVGGHWQDMQPPQRRERGRIGALDWLFARLAALLADRPPEAADGPALIAAAAALDGLVDAAEARLTSGGLAAGDLVRVLRPLAETARRAAAAAPPPPSGANGASPPAAAGSAPPTVVATAAPSSAPAISPSAAAQPAAAAGQPAAPAPAVPANAEDAARGFGALETAMRQYAALLREADLADPRAYVLARTVAWLPVQQPPPHTDRATLLNPPAAERIAGIASLVAAGQHREALALIETTVSSAIFWLDGQRLTVEAMTALGAQFLRAREAVSGLVVAFVRRFPALLDLTFASGEPFASPVTRRWLEETAGLVSHADGCGAGGDGEAATLIAEARTLADGGRGRDALGLLAEGLRTTAIGRERFLIRLAQGQIGLEHDMAGVTLPLAAHLADEADARDLESWEPELAVRASELWLKALAHPAAKSLPAEAHRTASDRARGRLARTDAATAARYLT